jgi:hypothetical protein
VGHCAFDLAGAKTKNVELDKCNILWIKLLENPLKKVVVDNKIQKISEKESAESDCMQAKNRINMSLARQRWGNRNLGHGFFSKPNIEAASRDVGKSGQSE